MFLKLRYQVVLPQILTLLFLTVFSAGADVKLPAIIGDNMVLQSGIMAKVWGTADPGEKVTVTLGKEKSATTADKEGKWLVILIPFLAGSDPLEMTIEGKNTITLHDIVIGEVWVCSGQSNMQWDVRNSANAEKEIAEANYPMIRLFTVKRTVADQPLSDTEGKWVKCDPNTVPGFSAVGYFFGRDLHKALNVPVGLIHTSWGGTPAESWTTLSTLESDPEFKPILDRWKQGVDAYPQAEKKYQELLSQWEQDSQKAKSEGKPEPKKPQPPTPPDKNPWKPAGLYNAMIAPIIHYDIKGAIWYQGESNAGRAYQYRKLFPAMIQDWRRSWGQKDFPFLFVQLANFMETKPEPTDSSWAELREAQLMTLALPKTGMAVAIDVGEAQNIHPKNKQDVGHRLALAALANAYNKKIVFSGPAYESMAIEDGKIRLRFKHADDGLVTKNDEPLKGFAIAGDDHKFVWADTKIDGNSAVLVWSDKVPQPKAVRYAWADNPICSLYNKAGLPASPFRTDDFTGITKDKL